jgi:hypothetical protein
MGIWALLAHFVIDSRVTVEGHTYKALKLDTDWYLCRPPKIDCEYIFQEWVPHAPEAEDSKHSTANAVQEG